MIEEIFTMKNMKAAYERVRKKNYKSMNFVNLDKFQNNLDKELMRLRKKILKGIYIPQTAKGIEILKNFQAQEIFH
jgi:hypothetical protein